MKVQDLSKDKTPMYDVYFTLAPLNCVLRWFGLCCIRRDGNKLEYSWPQWRIIFMIILFFIATSSNIYFSFLVYNGTSIRFENVMPVVYMCGYMQFIVDVVLVHKYGRERCLYYYSVFEHTDRILGMRYYKKIRRSIIKMSVCFITIGFITFVSESVAFVISFGWFMATITSINHIYTTVKMLTSLDGIAQFTQVKYRLKRIEDILEMYYNNVENLPGVCKDVIRNNNWIRTRHKPKQLDLFSTSGYKQTNVILNLNKCYMLLLEQCDYLNNAFGLRILFGGLVFLIEIVMLTNLIIRLTTGGLTTMYGSVYPPIIATTMKALNCSLVGLCEINRCEQTYKQTDRIVRWIDHLLTNKKITVEVRETLKELKSLIITRPINFNAMNFYRVDYSALLSMASAVVTYTIILLQNMK